MKGRIFTAVALVVALGVFSIATAPPPSTAQGRSGDQQMARMRFVKDGVQTQASGVLQTGEVNTISAAVASTTRTEVVAAPASGSIYLRAILVEKATASTGIVTVTQGTGTNCATSPVVLFTIGVGSPPIGVYPVSILVPAAKALCLTTDASTTSVRALTN